MATEYLNAAFKTDLPAGLRFTLVAICDFVDHNGEWRIKHETLAAKTGHSRRTIVNHIDELVTLGVIEVRRTRRDDGRQGANVYRVKLLHSGPEIQSANPASQSAVSARQSATSADSRVQPLHTNYHQDSLPPSTTLTTNVRAEPDEAFETLWAEWEPFDMPKGNKGKAREAWCKHVAKSDVDPATVQRQARAYCDQCHRLQSKTQHVVTWLNQRGWEDDYDPPPDVGGMVDEALKRKWEQEDAVNEAADFRGDHQAPGGRLQAPARQAALAGPVRGDG